MTVSVLWLFRTEQSVFLQCVIVVFPDYTHLLFFRTNISHVCENYVRSKEECQYQESIQSSTPYGRVTKTQENITHKREKKKVLSQHVITRLQGTNKTV